MIKEAASIWAKYNKEDLIKAAIEYGSVATAAQEEVELAEESGVELDFDDINTYMWTLLEDHASTCSDNDSLKEAVELLLENGI